MNKSLVVNERIPVPARRLEALVQQLLKVKRQEAVRLIQAGGAVVNGKVLSRPQQVLEVGERLEIQFVPTSAPTGKRPADSAKRPLEIVFEDEHLVVVNKPPALLTVPTPRKEATTAISLLTKRLRRRDAAAEAFCVHRLDRGVSGLLVFGKRLDVAEALRDQFAERKPARRYVALVAGELREPSGTFRSYLTTDKDLNRHSTEDTEAGELAITHYRVLRTCRDATLVEVRLETGRRNQIRVHFAEAGHPVLGDARYGRDVKTRWKHRRMALHADELGFVHPVTGQRLKFQAPWPEEMRRYLQS